MRSQSYHRHRRFRVIVVGAGPAGASAAYWLGEAAQRVLVLEKEQLPRYKPCGGGIPKTVFDRFSFSFAIPTASGVIESWIRRVRFRFRNGREVAADLPDRTEATVMRDRFDFHVINHARAEVRDRCTVTALRQEMARVGVEIDGARHRGHPLPVHRHSEPLHQGRALLVGDAAGLMDPLLGEGIRHAVDSGKLAAESVLAGDPRRYAQRVRREIGRDLLWGRLWARLVYGLPWVSFEVAVRNPLFVKEFLRLLAGEISYRRMAARALPHVLLGLSRRMPVKHTAGPPPHSTHEFWRQTC